MLYFRGYPHVHAFINIAMDGDAPLSSGEHLAENPAWLDAAGVKALFEAAMRTETGADLALLPGGQRRRPAASGLRSGRETSTPWKAGRSPLKSSTSTARI